MWAPRTNADPLGEAKKHARRDHESDIEQRRELGNTTRTALGSPVSATGVIYPQGSYVCTAEERRDLDHFKNEGWCLVSPQDHALVVSLKEGFHDDKPWPGWLIELVGNAIVPKEEPCRSRKSAETNTGRPADAPTPDVRCEPTTPPADGSASRAGHAAASVRADTDWLRDRFVNPFHEKVEGFGDLTKPWAGEKSEPMTAREVNRRYLDHIGPWPWKPSVGNPVPGAVTFIPEAVVERIKREVSDQLAKAVETLDVGNRVAVEVKHQVNHELDAWEGNSYVAKYDDKLSGLIDRRVHEALRGFIERMAKG